MSPIRRDIHFTGGVPADLWLEHRALIDKLVTKHKLQAVAHFTSQAVATAESPLEIRLPNIRGGMRTPHFHLGDEVFQVGRKAWDEFASAVRKDLVQKLSEAKRLSFEQLADVADAVYSVT